MPVSNKPSLKLKKMSSKIDKEKLLRLAYSKLNIFPENRILTHTL